MKKIILIQTTLDRRVFFYETLHGILHIKRGGDLKGQFSLSITLPEHL